VKQNERKTKLRVTPSKLDALDLAEQLTEAQAELARVRQERDEAREQFDRHVEWAASQAEAAEQRITALEGALRAKVAEWRVAGKLAAALADKHEGDSAGNTFAFLKERRIWMTCADELDALLTPSPPVAAERASRGEASEGCVCTVPDGLVREWVSKARAVAKAKGYAVDSRASATDSGAQE
jgi:hypothetical protein